MEQAIRVSKRVLDPHHLRILAPSALILFVLLLLHLHLSGSAGKMEMKQQENKEVFQAAKRRELIQRENGGDEDQTLSKKGHPVVLVLH